MVYTTLLTCPIEQRSIRHEMFTDDTILSKISGNKTESVRFLSSASVNTTLQYLQTISLSKTDADFAGFVRSRGSIFDLLMKLHIIKTYKAA